MTFIEHKQTDKQPDRLNKFMYKNTEMYKSRASKTYKLRLTKVKPKAKVVVRR